MIGVNIYHYLIYNQNITQSYDYLFISLGQDLKGNCEFTIHVAYVNILRYVVRPIFVFCTFCWNAIFVSKCFGMFLGVKLFAQRYVSSLLIIFVLRVCERHCIQNFIFLPLFILQCRELGHLSAFSYKSVGSHAVNLAARDQTWTQVRRPCMDIELSLIFLVSFLEIATSLIL